MKGTYKHDDVCDTDHTNGVDDPDDVDGADDDDDVDDVVEVLSFPLQH